MFSMNVWKTRHYTSDHGGQPTANFKSLVQRQRRTDDQVSWVGNNTNRCACTAGETAPSSTCSSQHYVTVTQQPMGYIISDVTQTTTSVTSLRWQVSDRNAARGWSLSAVVSASESPSTTWLPRRRPRGQASDSPTSPRKAAVCCMPPSEKDWTLTSSEITWYVAKGILENRWSTLRETTRWQLRSITRPANDLFCSMKVSTTADCSYYLTVIFLGLGVWSLPVGLCLQSRPICRDNCVTVAVFHCKIEFNIKFYLQTIAISSVVPFCLKILAFYPCLLRKRFFKKLLMIKIAYVPIRIHRSRHYCTGLSCSWLNCCAVTMHACVENILSVVNLYTGPLWLGQWWATFKSNIALTSRIFQENSWIT